jgi:hypothetical protein
MLRKLGLAGVVMLVAGALAAADRPEPEFWAGKSSNKAKGVSAQQDTTDGNAKETAKRQADTRREPEWLKRLDKNDRATLTGGWKLQNLSGGTQSFTTPGDRAGQYAPNTYQGRQFQDWNNLATRQQIPSWNGSAPMFPRQMWSEGYVSPNTYCGPNQQTWTGMSTGRHQPNRGSGGWTWR